MSDDVTFNRRFKKGVLIFNVLLILLAITLVWHGCKKGKDEPSTIVASPTVKSPPTETVGPTNTPVPTVRPTHTTPEPAHEHELAPATSGPATGGNFAALPLPPNTTVHIGCSSDGVYCMEPMHAAYYAGQQEVLLANAGMRGTWRETHERLHAHQHWSINGGGPTDVTLNAWYGTTEGQSFMAEIGVAGAMWPYCTSPQNGIEAFACVGELYYNNPDKLSRMCSPCYRWARSNLP